MLSQGNDLPLHARASTDKRRHCRDDFVQCHVRLLDRQCRLSKMLGLQASGEKRSPPTTAQARQQKQWCLSMNYFFRIY